MQAWLCIYKTENKGKPSWQSRCILQTEGGETGTLTILTEFSISLISCLDTTRQRDVCEACYVSNNSCLYDTVPDIDDRATMMATKWSENVLLFVYYWSCHQTQLINSFYDYSCSMWQWEQLRVYCLLQEESMTGNTLSADSAWAYIAQRIKHDWWRDFLWSVNAAGCVIHFVDNILGIINTNCVLDSACTSYASL